MITEPLQPQAKRGAALTGPRPGPPFLPVPLLPSTTVREVCTESLVDVGLTQSLYSSKALAVSREGSEGWKISFLPWYPLSERVLPGVPLPVAG